MQHWAARRVARIAALHLERKMRKFLAGFSGSTLVLLAPMAMAQSVYDPITAAVDWSAVNGAVISVFALIAAVYVVFKGGKLILRALRGA